MKIYCYEKCTTCKKALNWLDEREIAYELMDIKGENPGESQLSRWIKISKLPIKRFFNTSGLRYRTLNLKDKLSDMNVEEQINLLASDGMLVKRPLVIGDDFILTGFREKEWKERFDSV